MEIEAEDYGKCIFTVMLREPSIRKDHWESIRAEAEPLVRQLLDLNDKMDGGGYTIVGYTKNGKKVLSEFERVRLAQEKLWKVKAAMLKVGDRVWLLNGEPEMYIGQDEPATVDSINKNFVYLEIYGFNDEHIVKISADEYILKAPKDWDKNEVKYSSKEYWLKQADKLEI